MPVVLVHGNPETDAIWDALRTHLDRDDVVTLSPPGFGAPVPEGFGASSNDYLAWLAGELRRIEEPVDLVGHDWGGGHVMRIAMTHPELIRSWVSDLAGCFDEAYVWHDAAQVWQTPGAGEESVAAMVAAPVSARASQFESLGMSPHVALRVAEAIDEDMGRCILALYRSAAQPAMANLGADLERAGARPGLVLIPTEDPYTGGEVLARRSAERCGAKVEVLEGLGHWWMCQDSARGAEVLGDFLNVL